MVTAIIAPCCPLHSWIGRSNVVLVPWLAQRLSNAVASSIFLSEMGLSWPHYLGFSSWSTGISKVELMVDVLLPLSGSHTVVHSSMQPSYHCTIKSELCASRLLLKFLYVDSRPVAQSISGLRVSTMAHAVLDSMPQLAWLAPPVREPGLNDPHIKPSLAPCGSPLRGQSSDHEGNKLWCALLREVVRVYWQFAEIYRCLQHRNRWVFIFLAILRVDIFVKTSWTMCEESRLAVPHNHWHNVGPFGLSKTSLRFSAIVYSWNSSNLTITALESNICNPSSRSSILCCLARSQVRITSFLFVDYGRSAGVLFVFLHLEEQVFLGCWRVNILCTRALYVWVTCSIWMFLLRSEFGWAPVRPKAQQSVYHPCRTLTCHTLLLRPAEISLVESCISCHLFEMILLTAFELDVAAVVGALWRPAWLLNQQCEIKALPYCQIFRSLEWLACL